MPLGIETMLTSDKCSAKLRAMKRYINQVRMFLHICGLSQQSIPPPKERGWGGGEGWDLEGTFKKLHIGGILINPINE